MRKDVRHTVLSLPTLVGCAAFPFLLVVPDTVQAQTQPKQFFACYVPRSGVVYRIKEPRLKNGCTGKSVEFSWTEGVPGHDHGALNGLGDDDHPEYVREGEAAGGDLGGSYPDPTVAKLQGSAVSATAPTDGQVLTFDGATSEWQPATPATGLTDHGLLGGLGDDDHNQYVLADGVRSTTNGFAVTGRLGTGTIPASGAGARLMWYPGKTAFRVGLVSGDAWDDANIGFHSVAMGDNTTASGDQSVAMGSHTTASGTFSTAMGAHASTNAHTGSFVYGDFSTSQVVNVQADNSFVVRAAGGTIFYSNRGLTAGVSLAPGAGAWASVSDRNRKHLFRTEDGESVLAKIAGVPIPSWTYKAQGAAIRHLGPMSQDFYAAFGLGPDDLTITTSDISGVNMLAIQALELRTRDLDDVRAELAETRQRLAALETALERLEAVTEANQR